MSTNVYKRFDPRVMEREERLGINRGLPTMRKNKTIIYYFFLSENKIKVRYIEFVSLERFADYRNNIIINYHIGSRSRGFIK